MNHVFLHEASDMTEAQVLVSYINAHGFHARIRDEHTRSTVPHMGLLLGRVLIEIPEDEALDASRLLEERERKREELLAKKPTGEMKEYEDLLAASQKTARSSFVSALLGLFFIPIVLNFYSLKLGYRVMRTESPVSSKSWRYLLAAGFFNCLAFWFWFNNIPLLKSLAKRFMDFI